MLPEARIADRWYRPPIDKVLWVEAPLGELVRQFAKKVDFGNACRVHRQVRIEFEETLPRGGIARIHRPANGVVVGCDKRFKVHRGPSVCRSGNSPSE